MRELSPALSAHVAGGATTLCRCWMLTRRDGVVLGFTDHDRTLVFDGVEFRAGSGLSASEAEAATGLQVAGSEISGALNDAAITEADILAGKYDDAEVAAYIVNWADVSQRLTTDVSTIGEIRRADKSFVVELRGPMHRLDQEQGRLYQRTCPATLGDARCKVVLAAFTTSVTVTASDTPAAFEAAALSGHAENWFAGGLATVTSGDSVGLVREIRASTDDGQVLLWTPLPQPLAPGDGVTLVAGCDKSFATCQAKFANIANFRGFPHIPTADFILSYARTGEGGHDGGLLDG